MTKYTATFADGTTITRKSERDYAVAWRQTWTNRKGIVCSETGFSVSADKASPSLPWIVYVNRSMSANERSKAKFVNAQYLIESGYRLEIVPTVAA